MSSDLATSASVPQRGRDALRKIAFIGEQARLNGHLPDRLPGLQSVRLDLAALQPEQALAALRDFEADAAVLLDPTSLPIEALEELRSCEALTLGLLVDGLPDRRWAHALGTLDRVACFDPALTGVRLGEGTIWRAVAPPISDALFGEVRRLHRPPRTMSIGRSTPHRESMLLPSKHHHDILQVIHGVTGPELAEFLRECDVGVHVAAQPGGGFGTQAAIHLAAGHLLLTEFLLPAHGLERNIDYLEVDSAAALESTLRRLARFPEMYHRLRVRGRLKAEQFRASRVFARLIYDLFADVAAFGRPQRL